MKSYAFILDPNPDFISKLLSLNIRDFILDCSVVSPDLFATLKAMSDDITLSVKVDIFSGKDVSGRFHDSKCVEATGRTLVNDVFFGVCPNNDEVRNFRLGQIKELLENYSWDGLLLNDAFYPTIWQSKDPEPFDICYCRNCVRKFTNYIHGEKLPQDLGALVEAIDGQYYLEWLEFKSKTITSFVRDAREIISSKGVPAKLGIYAIPWRDKEYGNGVTRLLGQDFYELSNYVDFISPMLFFKVLGKEASWVWSMFEYYDAFGKPLIPTLFTSKEFSSVPAHELEAFFTHLSSLCDAFIIEDTADLMSNENKFSSSFVVN